MPKPVKPNFDNKYFYTTDSFVTLEIESDVVPKSDNTVSLGSSTNRWANVYCVNSYIGDIKLMNDWVITERDENGEIIENGVRILNKNGEEIFKITEDGIYFKGKRLKLVFEE